jgi:hypothetical protein
MGRYIKTFLEELPQQSIFEDLEVLMDLNEPSEEELRIALKFQALYGPHLKVNVVTKVDPIGVSMNRCIEKSRGELLAIWNVDDLRTKSSIEDQICTMNNVPSSSIVYGPYKIVSSFGQTHGELVDNKDLDPKLFYKGMAAGPFFLFPRKFLSKVGLFDEQFKSGADYDFIQRLLTVGIPTSTKNLLGYYLNEGLGASTRKNSLQPIERTVIEIRYGHIESIDLRYLDSVADYNPSSILLAGEWFEMGSIISNYKEIRDRNSEAFKKKLSNSGLIERFKKKLFRVLFKM